MTENLNTDADPKRWWVLVGVGLAAILVAIDYTIVNFCTPTIQHYFSTSTTMLQWLMLGFGISFSACMTAAGKLADIIGRRKLLYASVIIFILASLGAGMAPNMHFLIAMRFLQGLSSAAIFPCGTAIIASTFPESEKAKVLGIYGSILGIGLAIGPVLGGLILSYLSWQWIFFINVPLSIIALFICIVMGQLKESKHIETPPIDWLGTISLIIGIGGLCFIISQGGYFGWHSPTIIFSLLITLIALISFVIDIKTHRYPVIPASLFMNKAFLLGAVVYIGTISVSWIVAFYSPLYLRLIAGFKISDASLWFSIITGMTIIVPIMSGYAFGQYSKSLITHISFLASILGFILLAFFNTHTPILLMVIAFIMAGFAWGAGNGIGMSIGLLSLKGHEDTGVVSGALLTILNVLATLFLAIATKLFTARESSALFAHLKTENISLNASQIYHIKAWLSDPEKTKALIASTGHSVADKVLALFHSSFMSGFSLVFTVFAILIAILYIVSIKNIKTLLGGARSA